jgi:hypothetical protein
MIVSVCMYVCMCVFMYVCLHVYMYDFMYVLCVYSLCTSPSYVSIQIDLNYNHVYITSPNRNV